MKKFLLVSMLFTSLLFLPSNSNSQDMKLPFKIGWISALSGPVTKYGADKAALLAVHDINARGGVLGRPLELIMEDGKCQSADAVAAVQKLISVDKVDFILGGHCSPETSAIAPIAESAKVILLAAISSNPDISQAGDYIFRVSASGTIPAENLARYMHEKLHFKTIAIITEITSYAMPPSEYLNKRFLEIGGRLVEFQSFNPGETDFRSILSKVRSKKPDAIYIAVQAPDTAALLVSQLGQQKIEAPLFGNEVTGNTVTAYPANKAQFEGMIFSEAAFNSNSKKTKEFIDEFKNYFHVDGLPYGFWTAEAYDGVMLLADVINRCGANKEAVKKCLYEVRNYEGVSGTISIDENGDGIRNYVLKVVRDGSVMEMSR